MPNFCLAVSATFHFLPSPLGVFELLDDVLVVDDARVGLVEDGVAGGVVAVEGQLVRRRHSVGGGVLKSGVRDDAGLGSLNPAS